VLIPNRRGKLTQLGIILTSVNIAEEKISGEIIQRYGRTNPPLHRLEHRPDGSSSPFQRKWLIQPILLHGRAEDVARLDLKEIESLLDQVKLTAFLRNFWKDYLEHVHAQS